MGLTFFFSSMMFVGVIWGSIHAWSNKASYLFFLMVAFLGFGISVTLQAGGADTTLSILKIIVGSLGFGFGFAGGQVGYEKTFGDQS